MDYSKIGFRFETDVKRQAKRCGEPIQNSSQPVRITQRMINDCDSIVIQNRENLKQLYDGKPINLAVQGLNYLGEITHKFQKLFNNQSNSLSPQELSNYFNGLNIWGLYKALGEQGMDGLYTYLLNKQASAVSCEAFSKLEEKLDKEIEKLKLSSPVIDPWVKEIIKKSDFDFTDFKKHGFSTPKEIPAPVLSDTARKASSEYFRNWIYSERIPDGFADGGRHMSFSVSGKPKIGTRELLIVDRKNDPKLQASINQFKSILNRNPYLSYKERMECLFAYVNELFSDNNWREHIRTFEDKIVKLGDVISAGAGCCRHKALTAKVIGDETGLNITIRRGYGCDNNGRKIAHTWNEVLLPDGKKYVFDTAQWKLLDTDSNDAFLKRYEKDGKQIY